MNKTFIAQITPPTSLIEPALWFIFHEEDILLTTDSGLSSIPKFMHMEMFHPVIKQQLFLGTYDNTPCFVITLLKKPETLPTNTSFLHIRQAHESISDSDLFSLASLGKQLLNWDMKTQFCGCCGGINKHSLNERAKICADCNTLTFPQITPAMLVLIWRKGEILLARSPHFLAGVYSLVAGFVEPGETLEQTVIREVKEEVGITIKNLSYFGSQSWPFPSNLMLGFIAEYDCGEIQIDFTELEDAQWFSLDKLPKLPKPISLSRHMIDTHLAKHL